MRKKPLTLREALTGKLTAREMNFLTTSFDIVGSIAIIEVRDELRHKEKLIGETILTMHRNLHTVCRRHSTHTGIFRLQQLRIIAGKRTKETEHCESRCIFTLHVEKCYFSVRSSSERLRIASLIAQHSLETGQKEHILVMFSGVAPFVCVIGKHASYESITGVELNPIAHAYALKNVKRNKIENVSLFNKDVRTFVSHTNVKFDRIIMPLPRTAEEFLDAALHVANNTCIIHLYGFLSEDQFALYQREIMQRCTDLGYTANIKTLVKCGQFSPHLFRICVDFEVHRHDSCG